MMERLRKLNYVSSEISLKYEDVVLKGRLVYDVIFILKT